jgi:hypothetical protein
MVSPAKKLEKVAVVMDTEKCTTGARPGRVAGDNPTTGPRVSPYAQRDVRQSRSTG